MFLKNNIEYIKACNFFNSDDLSWKHGHKFEKKYS